MEAAVASLADAVEAVDSEMPKEVIMEEQKLPEKILYYRKHFGDIHK